MQIRKWLSPIHIAMYAIHLHVVQTAPCVDVLTGVRIETTHTLAVSASNVAYTCRTCSLLAGHWLLLPAGV